MNTTSPPRTSLFRGISRTFLAGLLAALPLALTVVAIIWLAELFERFLGPSSAFGKVIGSLGLRFVSTEIMAYLVGALITLTIIFLLGLLVTTGMKSRWQALVDGIFSRVPLVRTIYGALTKVTRMLELNDQAEVKSMSAVICHFGGKGKGVAMLVLLTCTTPISRDGEDYYAVMIPTAPVPFGGAIFYVPVEWVEEAEFGFDGLLNIYMSMGATSPDYLGKPVAGAHDKPGR